MKDFLGFRPKYSVLGSKALPSKMSKLILSSVTLREGGAVQNESGFCGDLDATSQDVFGYCIGFEDKNGYSYELKTSGFTGTYTQSAQGDTYAASATNSDSGGDNVVALVIPALGVVASGCLNAATGTTTGSSIPGYYLDIDGSYEEKLAETSASTTIAQWQLVQGLGTRSAIDPEHAESTTRVMVMTSESEQANDA